MRAVEQTQLAWPPTVKLNGLGTHLPVSQAVFFYLNPVKAKGGEHAGQWKSIAKRITPKRKGGGVS